MKIKTLLFVLILSLNFISNADKIQVVTSITPIGSIVKMLLKDAAIINSIATTNGCPHHYQLKPSDLTKVQNADIAIYIDDQFDNFAKRLMIAHSKNIIKLSSIKTLKIIKNGNEINWHIWLSLDNVKIILHELTQRFTQMLPSMQEDINQNLAEAIKEIDNLETIKNKKLSEIVDVILLSNSTEYFFTDTKINLLKLYSANQKSLKYLNHLEKLLNNSINKCLVLSTDQDPRLYQKLNAKVIILESENWQILDVSHNMFHNKYLQMINQLKVCSKLYP